MNALLTVVVTFAVIYAAGAVALWVIDDQRKGRASLRAPRSCAHEVPDMHRSAYGLAVLLAALAVAAFAGRAPAAERRGPDHFREGSLRFTVLAGSGSAFDETYTVIGAGFGYYVLDGLEAGLEYEAWTGGERRIGRLSPQLTYVFPLDGVARPYAGIFYRRTFIDQYEDTNDAGARAGALFLYGRRAYLGIGAVAGRHLSCDRTVYDACSEVYPELLIAVLF